MLCYNFNHVLSRQTNKPAEPIATARKKDIFLALPFLGSQSEVLANVSNLVLVNFMVLSTLGLFLIILAGLSFFPYKDRFSRSQRSKVVYRANCWDCDSFYVGKTKRRLHDRKTEHFKALTQDCHAFALADHVISTGHDIKWDHFNILAAGKSDFQRKMKETLLISELKPSLNENVGSEKLFLYLFPLVVSNIGSINFVIVFYLVTSSPLYFCIF